PSEPPSLPPVFASEAKKPAELPKPTTPSRQAAVAPKSTVPLPPKQMVPAAKQMVPAAKQMAPAAKQPPAQRQLSKPEPAKPQKPELVARGKSSNGVASIEDIIAAAERDRGEAAAPRGIEIKPRPPKSQPVLVKS